MAVARSGRAVGDRALVKVGDLQKDKDISTGDRSLGANVNPSQLGNEVDLWPDRTGPQTRRELGARDASDVTFVGDRVEQKGPTKAQAQVQPPHMPSNQHEAAEATPGGHEHGPGTNPAADLAAEDIMGEDRPVPRTTAPDQQPTQWHPEEHGAPGVHIRDGHDRFATAPKTRGEAGGDPFAHAPVPGPNHMPTEAGQEFPPDVRP
jgi:hypothetical protein